MRRLVLGGFAAVLVLAVPAGAAAPTLSSVGVEARHPTAMFSAPKADGGTIYIASKPDRATDGSFLTENVEDLDILTDSEIQAGRWVSEDQLDPGTYFVMLRASLDFDACYIYDTGGYDPSCADGYSNMLPLTVPKPASRYSARVTAFRSIRRATLTLTAMPLGEDRPYQVCYRLQSKARRCLRGSLDGYSWEQAASDVLTVNTRPLPLVATFTWYVGARAVATKRVRVR
jgi:hypothetical protein